LPFLNIAGEADQQTFADGISDDLTTQLSKVSGLFVISRMTASKYGGHSNDVRRVARDLGVRYVLEGSVRRGGKKLRVNAKLIDATTGGHLWAETFDGPTADAFALQDRINGKIVAALQVYLTPDEKQRMQYRGTDNVEAYDAFLVAERYRTQSTTTKYKEAIEQYNKAIQIDPNFGPAYAGRGYVIWWREKFFGVRLGQAEERAREAARRALGQGEDELAHILLAKVHLYDTKSNFERAEKEARKAIEINPNSFEALTNLAEVLLYSGRAGPARQQFNDAIRLNPNYPRVYQLLRGQIEFEHKRYRVAINYINDACQRNYEVANRIKCNIYGGATYGYLGELQHGRNELARALYPRALTVDQLLSSIETLVAVRLPFKNKSSQQHLLAGVRKALKK
jgi:adenylate cyclase